MSATSIPQGFKALPLSITQLSLSAVLKCGQSFRWAPFPLLSPGNIGLGAVQVNEPTHEYRFCLKDRVVCLRQSDEFLFYRSIYADVSSTSSPGSSSSSKRETELETETLAFIRDYFQLDTDLLALYEEWSASDPVFRSLRARFSGIRMLRQDPWECLISFICSSNNNISRISKMVQNLCTHFSPPLLTLSPPYSVLSSPSTLPAISSPESIVYHPFPPPSALSSPTVSSKLRALGFGYRADFIQKTAAMLLEEHSSDAGVFEFLSGLRKKDTETARAELLKLMGVGRKVADCILLMSLDKREVVPVDTHVYQIAVKHYGMRGPGSSTSKVAMRPKLYDEVNMRLAKIWGSYAGWAHSILFTADLKSFSAYGLPTPSPSVSPTKSSLSSRASTPQNSPSPRKKRKQAQLEIPAAVDIETTSCKEEVLPDGSLADRVKRRRRITVILIAENTKEW